MRTIAWVALITVAFSTVRARAADELLVLCGASVLDPAGERLLESRVVLVSGNRIQSVLAEVPTTFPANARIIDLRGLTLLPGLIDLHSHLLLHPYNEALWDDQVLKESLELRTIRGVVAARATLEAGFTTLRDLGTEGAGFADVGLRDAIGQGIIPGPRVFASTRAIVATGCYGPSGFDPRWIVPKGAQEASGPDDVRKAVREQIAAGADWIKFYADYHRRAGDPATPTFSLQEMEAIVNEAQSAGIPVAAHATTAEGITRAVTAGVDTIEHGYEATDEVLAEMKQKGTVLCPTLAASEAYARYFENWKPGMADSRSIRNSKASFARALKAGVTIACGSDVGVFPHGDNARELELMVSYGMKPDAAVRAATLVAGRVLRRGKDLGRVQAGYLADLIAVRGNPLDDIGTLRQPVLVVKDGKIFVDRRPH